MLMREVPLETVLELLIDHRGKTPKKLGGDFTEAGVPAISAIHVKNGRINWNERYRYVSEEMFERWMPEKTKRGDVLLTSEAPLGEVAQVPGDDPLVLSQRLFGLRGKEGVLDSTYLRYFLQSEIGQKRLLANESGSTVSGIRQALLRQVLVPLPPFAAQQGVAATLGAFDDLIQTNRDLAADLEHLLFAIVDRCAVDAPRTPFGDLAWRAVERSSVNEMSAGETYLGLEHFGVDGEGLIGRGTVDGINSPSLRFKSGDILYGKLRPYFRKVARPGFSGVCSAEAWVLRAKEGHAQAVVHAVVNSPQFSVVAMAGNSGTKMPRADWDHIAKFEVPDLRDVLSDEDVAALDTLWAAACDLRADNEALTRQRDELLPLLMSGRVRVSELEGVA